MTTTSAELSLRSNPTLNTLTGESEAAQEMWKFAEHAAKSNSNVFLTGETGTGKNYLARAIHNISKVIGQFVKVDCGLTTETLWETTLFGHVAGAFTDGKEAKKGVVEQAYRGTLFFDELMNVPPSMQGKLLSVTDKDSFRLVGGTAILNVDTRIIAATNVVPEEAVARGELRPDLFYRLNVIAFHVPPLRERVADIPLLAKLRLDQVAPRKRFSDLAIKELQRYAWPGNIRELENVVERSVFYTRGEDEIHPVDVIPHLRGINGLQIATPMPIVREIAPCAEFYGKGGTKLLSLREFRGQSERQYLLHVLGETKGNISRAADIIGVSRTAVYKLIEKLGIKTPLPA